MLVGQLAIDLENRMGLVRDLATRDAMNHCFALRAKNSEF